MHPPNLIMVEEHNWGKNLGYDKRGSGNLAINCEQDELHKLPDAGSPFFASDQTVTAQF